jgi:hypothetical protein
MPFQTRKLRLREVKPLAPGSQSLSVVVELKSMEFQGKFQSLSLQLIPGIIEVGRLVAQTLG